MLRDRILLYRESHLMGRNCESCESSSHTFDNCPLLKYVPNRELILRKHIYSEIQGRKAINRKKNQKTKNALFNNFDPIKSFNSSKISKEDSDDADSEEDDDKEPDIPMRRGSKRKLFIKSKSSISNSLKNEQKEDTEDEEENDDAENHSRKENYHSIGTMHSKNSTYPAQEFGLIFGGLNTEKMFNFEHYFPYNNCDEVLKFFESFKMKESIVKKNHSKFKSKLINPKLMEKALGKPKINISSGLIQFRNMQNFFLKRKMTNKK